MPAGEVLVLVNRRKLGNAIRDALNARAQQNDRQWTAQSFYLVVLQVSNTDKFVAERLSYVLRLPNRKGCR